jgi:hypothetical protein
LKYDAGKLSDDILTMGSAAAQEFAASLSLKHCLQLWKCGDGTNRNLQQYTKIIAAR